jgi:hypothetical protein
VRHLRQKDLADQIMSELRLPSKTTDKETNPRYRCSACLQEREGE